MTIAISRPQTHRMTAELAALIARRWPRAATPEFPLNKCSARWRKASRQNVYPGCTASALSDQKFISAVRHSGRHPIHPNPTMAMSINIAPSSVNSAAIRETFANQIVATSGADPSSAAGNRIETVQANASFGRLISTSRLPAIASNDLCLGLNRRPRRRPGADRTTSCLTLSFEPVALEPSKHAAKSENPEVLPRAHCTTLRTGAQGTRSAVRPDSGDRKRADYV